MLLRKTLSLVVVMLVLSTAVLAEDKDHADGTQKTDDTTATGRADGDADKKLKEKSVDALAGLFPSAPKSYIKDALADKIPDAIAKEKEGNSQPMSDVLTPLFGTLNNDQFDKLMKDVDERITKEKAVDGTVDNKFIDLLEAVKKYGKVVQGTPDETTDKNKAEAGTFKKDFDAQQTKNKEFLAKVEKVKSLTKPEQKAEREKLQKEILGSVNQKAVLGFIKGQLDKGSDGNKQIARDLRDALASKTESGHNVIDTVWNGQTERIIWDSKDPASADKIFEEYAKERKNFAATAVAPSNHAQPQTSFSLDANGKLAKAVPTGFKPPVVEQPVQPTQGTQQGQTSQQQQQGTGGSGNSGSLKVSDVTAALTDSGKCGMCHGSSMPALSVKGNDVKGLKILMGNPPQEFDIAAIGAKLGTMGGGKVSAAAKTFWDQLTKAQ